MIFDIDGTEMVEGVGEESKLAVGVGGDWGFILGSRIRGIELVVGGGGGRRKRAGVASASAVYGDLCLAHGLRDF